MNYLKNLLANYKFDPSKFRLGMRTIKTGLAVKVPICNPSHPNRWKINKTKKTAVFCLRENFDKSVHFGFSRVVGNSVGGFLSLIFFFINQFFDYHFWVTLVFIPIFSMLGIMINVAINNKAGIIGGTSALLIITLSIPPGDTVLYVFARIFETFCGVFVAIIVNADVNEVRKLIRRREHK